MTQITEPLDFQIFDRMLKDDNKDLVCSTTLVESTKDPRGCIISFAIESYELAVDSRNQADGFYGEYFFVCIGVKRSALEATRKKMMSETEPISFPEGPSIDSLIPKY